MPRIAKRNAPVVDLSRVRAERRLRTYREKIHQVLDSNRKAIGRLHATGALFSRQGIKAGRDLLLAHQHLLRVLSLIDHLSDQGELPAPKAPQTVDAVYRELDQLLHRTNTLTTRTGQYLAGL